eukprot:SAG31_NODE_34611_length_331_cov_0.879310_1_plen_21_part_01
MQLELILRVSATFDCRRPNAI